MSIGHGSIREQELEALADLRLIFLDINTMDALAREFPGGYTPEGVCLYTRNELMAIPGISHGSASRIRKWLAANGKTLRD